MAPISELDRFRQVWDMEAQLTTKLLESLPTDQYDFRPDPGGRSLGEMAWHLAEIEGYISYGIANGAVTFQEAPPNMQRPREVRPLAPGYRRMHTDSVERLAKLTQPDLDREMPFADRRMKIRDILWGAILMHLVHHRGQLSLMCRMAGGTPPGIYGPNREEMAEMQEKMQAAKL
ncbi:MAG: DinB family protein [Gemmatimonadales bacterium]